MSNVRPHINMDSYLSNPWNNAVALLVTHYERQELSTGSCFFWSHASRIFLVTNWHNLAGRNPLTGQLMSKTGAIPDRVTFGAFRQVSAANAQGFFELKYVLVEVILCKSDFTEPKWIEHPSFGRKVDIAAIDVTDHIQGLQIAAVNMLESDARLDVFASQDVFVVGFPFGLIEKAPAPIWKRGSIALDPTFNPDGLPKMLIDTATREGMSGSVVIARHVVVNRDYPKKDGTMAQPVLFENMNLVLGIYSGRHYPDHEKAQLGIVWKRSAVEETVAARKAASV
jgi:hypothetical protein